MTLEWNDIKSATSALAPSQALEVARIAQMAADDLARSASLPGKTSYQSYARRLSRRLALRRSLGAMPAHVQAPLWATGATINQSDVVRLSTGQLLVAINVAAGVTGATEPVLTAGTDPGAITDNTVTWWNTGEVTKVRAAGNFGITVADNAGNSPMGTVVNPWTSPDKFERRSTNTLELIAGADVYGYRTMSWSFLDGSTNDNGFGANGKQGRYRTEVFSTEADVIDIAYFATVAASLDQRAYILVDGEYATEAPIIPAAVGGSRYWRVTVPGGRKYREIEVRTSGTINLRHVAVDADCTINPPIDAGTACGMFMDSYGFTESPTLTASLFDLAVQLGNQLGFKHTMVASLGGTSYSVDSTGRFGLEKLLNLNNFAGYKFDCVVNAYSFNAAGGGVAPAVETASMKRCVQKQRAEICKDGIIVVVNDHYRAPAQGAAHDAMHAAMKTAFVELGDVNSILISPMDGSIMRSTGEYIRAPGTAYLTPEIATWAIGIDAAHLTPAGRVLYTARLVADILAGFDAMM